MTDDERLNLVLEFAVVLYVNGQATAQMLAATAQLSRALGLDASIAPRWGLLELVANDSGRSLIAQAAADPAGG